MIGGIDQSLVNYGRAGSIAIQAQALNASATSLTAQAASGLVSTGITGLGRATRNVLDFQVQLANLNAWNQNATVAQSRLGVASTALTQLGTISQQLETNLLSLQGDNGDTAQTSITNLAAEARSTLGQVGTLLNTDVAGTYVFAGRNSTTQPIPDPGSLASSSLASTIGSTLSGLDANGSAATLKAILSAAGDTTPGATPFDATITSKNQSVPIGPSGLSVSTSLPVTSPGPASATSSGSSVRDLVAVLTTLSQLTPADLSRPQYQSLLSGLRTITMGVSTGIRSLQSSVGLSQQDTTSAIALNTATVNLATQQIGNASSVDAAAVSVKLSATNVQLQASYNLVSDQRSLSLAQYL